MTVSRGLSYARIHNALVVAVRDGTYYGLVWDKDTGLITVLEDPSNLKSPATILVNEVRASFGDAIRHRRTAAQERHNWRFKALVKFDDPVSFEKFEQSVTHTRLRLQRNDPNNQPQVDFELVEAAYDHAHHEATRGSAVTFLFDVKLSPV